MQLLKQVHPQLRVAQVEFLLTVALNPNRSQSELAVECGYTLAAVSRLVDTMGETGRRDGKGGALARARAAQERRLPLLQVSRVCLFVSVVGIGLGRLVN